MAARFPDNELPENATTPERVFLERRRVVQALGLGAVGLTAAFAARWGGFLSATTEGDDSPGEFPPAIGDLGKDLFPGKRAKAYKIEPRTLTPQRIASSFNNFCEFTSQKSQVWKLARGFEVDPWKVEIGGLVEKPFTLGLEDLLTLAPLEERLYRLRCVEAWAMQVPWTGYPLSKLIERCKPLGKAKYIRFVSILDLDRLPGQRRDRHWPWPYFEALRLDEARHDLAFVAVGIYGRGLPMQHGAPWRIVTPWKYGYKSPKSMVRIEFTEKRPGTFWNKAIPEEYGFYSNVNPNKPHPRWSQATERDIGTGDRRPTLPYNGYGEEVSGLYTGNEY